MPGRIALWLGVVCASFVALIVLVVLGRGAVQTTHTDLRMQVEAVALALANSSDAAATGADLSLELRRQAVGATGSARRLLAMRKPNGQSARMVMALDMQDRTGQWRQAEESLGAELQSRMRDLLDNAPRRFADELACAGRDQHCLIAMASRSSQDGQASVAVLAYEDKLAVLTPYYIAGSIMLALGLIGLGMLALHGGKPADPAAAATAGPRRRVDDLPLFTNMDDTQFRLDLQSGHLHLPRQWLADIGHAGRAQGDDRRLWERLLHRDDRDEARHALSRLASGLMDKAEVMLRFARADRDEPAETWLRLRTERSAREGRVMAITGSMTDISGIAWRLRAAEAKLTEAERANETKSRFLATMSHEIRTPLNAILGFTETLSARYFGPLNQRQAEYLEDIHTAARHLLELINDILDYSRIEAGEMELTEEPVRLDVLLEDVRRLHRVLAEKGGVELSVATAGAVPPVLADRRALLQVLTNLTSNAIKFTRRGGRVTISAAETQDGLVLHVADTGVGIPADMLPEITRPFRMVQANRRPDVEGTGLGLSIVRSLVDLHDGTLAISSTEGEGTTVTITLPPERLIHKPLTLASDEQPAAFQQGAEL